MRFSRNIIPAIVPAVGLSLVLTACGNQEPIQTAEQINTGHEGTSVTIADASLTKFSPVIKAALGTLYEDKMCSVDLTVKDLAKYPDLYNIGNRGTAAGRGFSGGELYIASDINPDAEKINIEHLATHEGLHACVKTERAMSEAIVLPKTGLKATYARGFYLSVGKPAGKDSLNGTGSLDEAAVEWTAEQVTTARSTNTRAYSATTALFGDLAVEHSITPLQVAKMHENSDIAGITEVLTSETATADRIGCVVVEFVKLQTGQTTYPKARSGIENC